MKQNTCHLTWLYKLQISLSSCLGCFGQNTNILSHQKESQVQLQLSFSWWQKLESCPDWPPSRVSFKICFLWKFPRCDGSQWKCKKTWLNYNFCYCHVLWCRSYTLFYGHLKILLKLKNSRIWLYTIKVVLWRKLWLSKLSHFRT